MLDQPADSPHPVIQHYLRLRDIAVAKLSAERSGHTLQPTALIHEAYVRMAKGPADRWDNSADFLSCAGNVMRNVLIDHARARGRAKRQPGGSRIPLEELADAATSATPEIGHEDVLALGSAIDQLAAVSPEAGRVVRLRYYAGLSVEQTAAEMGVCPRSVKKKTHYAVAWLAHKLADPRA